MAPSPSNGNHFIPQMTLASSNMMQIPYNENFYGGTFHHSYDEYHNSSPYFDPSSAQAPPNQQLYYPETQSPPYHDQGAMSNYAQFNAPQPKTDFHTGNSTPHQEISRVNSDDKVEVTTLDDPAVQAFMEKRRQKKQRQKDERKVKEMMIEAALMGVSPTKLINESLTPADEKQIPSNSTLQPGSRPPVPPMQKAASTQQIPANAFSQSKSGHQMGIPSAASGSHPSSRRPSQTSTPAEDIDYQQYQYQQSQQQQQSHIIGLEPTARGRKNSFEEAGMTSQPIQYQQQQHQQVRSNGDRTRTSSFDRAVDPKAYPQQQNGSGNRLHHQQQPPQAAEKYTLSAYVPDHVAENYQNRPLPPHPENESPLRAHTLAGPQSPSGAAGGNPYTFATDSQQQMVNIKGSSTEKVMSPSMQQHQQQQMYQQSQHQYAQPPEVQLVRKASKEKLPVPSHHQPQQFYQPAQQHQTVHADAEQQLMRKPSKEKLLAPQTYVPQQAQPQYQSQQTQPSQQVQATPILQATGLAQVSNSGGPSSPLRKLSSVERMVVPPPITISDTPHSSHQQQTQLVPATTPSAAQPVYDVLHIMHPDNAEILKIAAALLQKARRHPNLQRPEGLPKEVAAAQLATMWLNQATFVRRKGPSQSQQQQPVQQPVLAGRSGDGKADVAMNQPHSAQQAQQTPYHHHNSEPDMKIHSSQNVQIVAQQQTQVQPQPPMQQYSSTQQQLPLQSRSKSPTKAYHQPQHPGQSQLLQAPLQQLPPQQTVYPPSASQDYQSSMQHSPYLMPSSQVDSPLGQTPRVRQVLRVTEDQIPSDPPRRPSPGPLRQQSSQSANPQAMHQPQVQTVPSNESQIQREQSRHGSSGRPQPTSRLQSNAQTMPASTPAPYVTQTPSNGGLSKQPSANMGYYANNTSSTQPLPQQQLATRQASHQAPQQQQQLQIHQHQERIQQQILQQQQQQQQQVYYQQEEYEDFMGGYDPNLDAAYEDFPDLDDIDIPLDDYPGQHHHGNSNNVLNSHQPLQSQPQGWQCKFCTLINDFTQASCSACEAPGPFGM